MACTPVGDITRGPMRGRLPPSPRGAVRVVEGTALHQTLIKRRWVARREEARWRRGGGEEVATAAARSWRGVGEELASRRAGGEEDVRRAARTKETVRRRRGGGK